MTAAAIVAVAFPISCGAPDTTVIGSRIVYGADDRREHYEVGDAAARAILEGAMVALVPRAHARIENGAFALEAPSLEEADDLCPRVRFAEQPAAAFCTGVVRDATRRRCECAW